MADSSNSRLADSDGFLGEFYDVENSDTEEYSMPDDFPAGKFVKSVSVLRE